MNCVKRAGMGLADDVGRGVRFGRKDLEFVCGVPSFIYGIEIRVTAFHETRNRGGSDVTCPATGI